MTEPDDVHHVIALTVHHDFPARALRLEALGLDHDARGWRICLRKHTERECADASDNDGQEFCFHVNQAKAIAVAILCCI